MPRSETPPVEPNEGLRTHSQRDAVLSECDATEARSLRRVARGTLCLDVTDPSNPGGRIGPFEILDRLGRALVVGGRGAGKTTLTRVVAAATARSGLDPAARCPIMVTASLLAGPRIDRSELGRLNPALGEEGVRRALDEGQAAVFVDSLDEAVSPEVAKESIAALAEAHPACAFLVTTRPLPARVPGVPASAIRGFTSVRFAPARLPITPAYELSGRRTPSARAALVGAEIDRRLAEWAKGDVLGRMTPDERLAIAAGIGLGLHVHRALELPIARLAASLPSWLPLGFSAAKNRVTLLDPVVADYTPAPDVAPMVEEMRALSGLLVEKRPGVIAFADIAFQEYLAAIASMGSESLLEELFWSRADPWWQPVLVFASALPERLAKVKRPVDLVRMVLEEDTASTSTTTFLAAQIADAAPELPPDLRRTIDRRLRASVPPRSSVQVWHLVDDVGEIAGPALVKAIDAAGPNERACIATALGRIHHPPALRALADLAIDEELTSEPLVCWAWNADVVVQRGPVAFFAFAALFNLALSNPAAGPVFEESLARVPLDCFETFFRVVAGKLVNDDYWGKPPEPERDPDRVAEMLESIRAAMERRSKTSPRPRG